MFSFYDKILMYNVVSAATYLLVQLLFHRFLPVAWQFLYSNFFFFSEGEKFRVFGSLLLHYSFPIILPFFLCQLLFSSFIPLEEELKLGKMISYTQLYIVLQIRIGNTVLEQHGWELQGLWLFSFPNPTPCFLTRKGKDGKSC